MTSIEGEINPINDQEEEQYKEEEQPEEEGEDTEEDSLERTNDYPES